MIADHGTQIDIPHTVENIRLDDITCLTKLRDQFFHLIALRRLVTAARRTMLGKAAGTLDKMQVILVTPCLDIRFFHEIQRADQFHAGKV